MPSALITGTSTGIGYETSLAFARAGYHAVATMRNLAKAGPLREAGEKEGLSLEVRALDVTDTASIEALMSGLDVPDVLVNNAGVGGAAPLELVSDADHRAIFETNYFGAVAMMQAVMPGMRERGSGHIVNISSGAGRYPTPNQAPYAASKHALECTSEVAAHELSPFGVHVTIIEPGIVKTAIFENSADKTYWDKQSPYVQLLRRTGKLYKLELQNPGLPEDVARLVVDAVKSERPPLRVIAGEDARQLIEGRRNMSDEDWVALGGNLSDEEYARRFKKFFGFDLP
jgi:NAD(P)-dependent dehydrogenase (short-subunit alcohol dehydrogenase family)